ncbi:MAG: hypothetical protein FWE29_01445 [Defluviitaleaceae bacterium]|nr:hypothetical protein [Defluviitaleaceae bacterium]
MQTHIESLIVKINDDNRMIGKLLSEKKKIMSNLHNALESKRRSKIALEENQMNAFSKFMSYYENEKKSISEQFGLMCSKKESKHTYDMVSTDLYSFNEWQVNMMRKIKEVVEEGEEVLEIINSQ